MALTLEALEQDLKAKLAYCDARLAEASRSGFTEAARKLRQQQIQLRSSYLEIREAQCELQSANIEAVHSDLTTLLITSLSRPAPFDWNKLLIRVDEFDLDADSNLRLPPKPRRIMPRKPGPIGKLMPWIDRSYRQQHAKAVKRFEMERSNYQAILEKRRIALQKRVVTARNHNERMMRLRELYQNADPAVVSAIVLHALSNSELPTSLTVTYHASFCQESRAIAVECIVPNADESIPRTEHYRYVIATDSIDAVKMSDQKRDARYRFIIAQLGLRIMSEIFRVDGEKIIAGITLNIAVESVDPSTGQNVRSSLMSGHCTRIQFDKFDLHRVDPIACLEGLNAYISPRLTEAVLVQPALEFDNLDTRFIGERYILNCLESRPNLMDLNPREFEHLISNLFNAMGLQTSVTRASHDGGVDCVARDLRPVLGGKVVIQAKRYRGTVNVSAVRDLFGTMINEGANKGILVTTSRFGPSAYEFARDKPIELVTGSQLLHLLKEHTGVEAKITGGQKRVTGRAA